jgi:hypothetical protein
MKILFVLSFLLIPVHEQTIKTAFSVDTTESSWISWDASSGRVVFRSNRIIYIHDVNEKYIELNFFPAFFLSNIIIYSIL